MPTQSHHAATALPCLVIEDDITDQKMVRRAFSGARVPAELVFVETISEARRALTQKRFSMVLCDNGLPDGCGSQFAQELTAHPEMDGTHVVIVSGWPSPFMWSKARRAGLQVIDKNDNAMRKLRDLFRDHFAKRRTAA